MKPSAEGGMKKPRTAHCRYCSRDDVPITDKGGFKSHVDAAGKPCIGHPIPRPLPARTPPKKIKGPFSKEPGRRRR